MKKTIISLLVTFLFSFPAYAEKNNNFMHRKDSLAIKVGYHFMESSDLTDFWGIDEEDYDGFVFELEFGHKFGSLGLDVALGYYEADETYHSVGVFASSNDFTVRNYYISPTLKGFVPLDEIAVLYLGAGPDLYYSEYDYIESGYINTVAYRYHGDDTFTTLGFHALIGIEWYVCPDPQKQGFYDAPVSFFLEYKYSWVEVDDVDKRVISLANQIFDTNYPAHDFEVGGSSIFMGLRWHF